MAPNEETGTTAERSLDRLWATMGTARATVAAVMVALQVGLLALGTTASWAGLFLCSAHLAAALATLSIWPRIQARPHWRWPWLPTVGLDGAVFAGLQVMQPGGLNYSLLFALPVLMAATLGPQRRALATAASVTLFLLGEATWGWWLRGEETSARLLQTALAGTAYFLMALLARHLAVRLAREEALAETSQQVARTQAEVNALVIEALNDGVLVVDRALHVWAANPAAWRLLGRAPQENQPTANLRPEENWPNRMDTKTELMPLAQVIRRSLNQQRPLVQEMALDLADRHQQLRIRTHPITGLQPGETGPACVVFMDDLHELEARVRAEKLAGMGRMTVAVAHEIRNPLAAISQASQLLHEELQDPMQQRLGQMIEQNTRRLNRIVEDVLDVVRVPSRPATTDTLPLPLDATVQTILEEWCGQHACTVRLVRDLQAPQAMVRFDAEHLRRVLINLLDNAHRYASMGPGAIRVESRLLELPDEPPQGTATADAQPRLPDAGMKDQPVEAPPRKQAQLSVWSDGLPLEPGILRHLFEPFFSSESRSSGMGLYLCRELCDRYQARLDYQRSLRGETAGNEFFVGMPLFAAKP